MSDIVSVFGQPVEFRTHILGSMDAPEWLQVPPASAVSMENAGATPHPTSPSMAGIHVGNVNKSIIADTVQNAQDVNFGNLVSWWRNGSRGSLTML